MFGPVGMVSPSHGKKNKQKKIMSVERKNKFCYRMFKHLLDIFVQARTYLVDSEMFNISLEDFIVFTVETI